MSYPTLEGDSGTPARSHPRVEFWSGIKAELPLLVGVVPFGMIYGVLALSAGIPPAAAQAMSAIVFAGSSQFVSAQLFGVGAPGAVIVITAAFINLRHALYSASVAPHIRYLHPVWKWILAYLLTDEAYAVAITHYEPERPSHETGNKHWYFLGAGLALWSTWQLSTALGIFLGARVPDSWSLDFTLALTFIALVVPGLKDRPALAAALTAGVCAVLWIGFPFRLGLVAAALVGITVGVVLEGRR
jgi:4-azaleucine resistance transporter AzlC